MQLKKKGAVKRIIYTLAFLILAGISGSIQGQNLLQNPSFESPEGWDHLWILSTTDPSSSSALAEPVTSDVHEGLRSVEVSNSVKLKWTYLYTDMVNAPIELRAGKKYEVKGWLKVIEMGKETNLSIYWNNSTESLSFYSDNPDPATHPDWFMVKDTIYPATNCVDGYLSLGFRSDKEGLFPVGSLLMDDFSVERIPEDSDTDILNVEVKEQASPARIDYMAATIKLALESGTKVSEVVLELIEVSPGAKVTPAAGEVVDLSGPAAFTVTAKDGVTTQDWNVEVEVLPSSATEILEFTLPGQTGLTGIDPSLHTVDVHVPFGTDLTSLIPEISTSEGATIDPVQGTVIDFTAPVLFTVTAEDGTTQQIWTVHVSESAPSTAAEIIGFNFPDQLGDAVIDEGSHTVALVVPFGSDVTALVPTIEISAGALVDPGSGVPADFSIPVEYTVTAQDGTTQQKWTVAVSFAANTAADIVGFTLSGQEANVVIDPDRKEVNVEVSSGTDITSLIPSFELSSGAVVSPASGTVTDFTSPVTYTITAEDGSTVQAWTVTVTRLTASSAEVIAFTLPEQAGSASIDSEARTIAIEVDPGTDLSSLIPDIQVSPGATVAPASGEMIDFSSDVTLTVTAEDGTTKQSWVVTVTVGSTATGIRGDQGVDNHIYPNPATSFIVVEMNKTGEIYVQDLHGRILFSAKNVDSRTTIPVSEFERGIYLVTLTSGARRQVYKVVLE